MSKQPLVEPRFPTPGALVEAIQNRVDGARAQLWHWLRTPIRRLMEELVHRHRLDHSLERLTEHALHSTEVYLRYRPLEEFASLNLAAFLGTVLLQVARRWLPSADANREEQRFAVHGPRSAVLRLPEVEGYLCQSVFLPYEKIGSTWYGGDWCGGLKTEDGALWVLVADVTGHGYAAYLLAHSLPEVWQMCWTDGPRAGRQPGEVLAAMHDLLMECLPEDTYVECTLVRLDRDGEVTVAPAGGSRLLVRNKRANRIDLIKLHGFWLGLERPIAEDQTTYQLEDGDELLVGSDGVFDQLIEYEGSSAGLARLVTRALQEQTGPDPGLLQAVRKLLQQALGTQPQKDDITMVAVRKKG